MTPSAQVDTSAAPDQTTERARPSTTGPLGLREYAILVGVGAFVTTFAQSRVLANLPTTFLLKEHFNLQKEDVALFLYWVTFPWNVKPLVGILIDGFPLFGTRRRYYMLIGALGAGVFWIAMGLFAGAYHLLLYVTLGMNIMTVLASTVMGALMVEAGHRFGASGRMSSLRQVVQNAASVAAPALGGYLAGKAYGWTAGIGAAATLGLAVCAFKFLREPQADGRAAVGPLALERTRVPAGMYAGLVAITLLATVLLQFDELKNVSYSLYGLGAAFAIVIALSVTPTSNAVVAGAQGQLGQIFRSRSLWLALMMMFLFYTVPGFNTALVYQQSDVLKFSKSLIGLLGSLEGIFGIGAAALYVVFCRRLNLRRLLVISIAFDALATYFYVFYSAKTAPFIHALYGPYGGFAAIMVELTIMDLAIRSTPRGCEALGFALLMSVRNFGIGISDVVGTQMMDQYHVGFNALITFNAVTTAAVLLVIPLLPATIVGTREGQS